MSLMRAETGMNIRQAEGYDAVRVVTKPKLTRAITYSTKEVGYLLGIKPGSVQKYHTRHGIGSKPGKRLLEFTCEDIAEIRKHIAWGPRIARERDEK